MEVFPRLGLGTFLLPNDSTTTESVRYAIEHAGYRHIDCAWAYFNEKVIGDAIHDVITRNILKREELWITSKLWNTAHHKEDVEAQCLETLKALQLDYLDLYLMHWPQAFQKIEGNYFPKENGKILIDETVNVFETWKAMEELVKKGLVKRIGVSNFTIELMEKLRYSPDVTIQPYTNQVECHLYMQQGALVDYCLKRNIFVTAYRSIGQPGVDHPGIPKILDDAELNNIAKELNQPVAKVAIKFLQQLSPNIVVLVKSLNPERIKSNIELDFEISENQMERLKILEKCLRYSDMKKLWGYDIYGDQW